ncbi:MAG: hypothetical protein H8F28_11725 [Fibrella sp.]|nr:hypothetical protein [Armatimonadota bacterium]
MTIQYFEKEQSKNEVSRPTGRFFGVQDETHTVSHAKTNIEAVTARKAEFFTARLRRVAWNRFLLSLPSAVIMMVCFSMGFRWLVNADIPWLRGEGVREYAFFAVLIPAWASMAKLEKIIRSFIGDQHFDC